MLTNALLLQAELLEVMKHGGTIPAPKYNTLDDYVAEEAVIDDITEDVIDYGHVSVEVHFDAAQAHSSGGLGSHKRQGLCML